MRKLIIAFLLLTLSLNVIADPTDNFSISNSLSRNYKKSSKQKSGFDRTKLLLGPGFGFGAGYRAFSINLAPSLAYCLTDNFHVGATLGFGYMQYSVDSTYFNTTTNQNTLKNIRYKFPTYTFGLMARYIILQRILLNFEPQISNVKFLNKSHINTATGQLIEDKTRLSISSVLLGVGYAQKFSRYGYYFISINYDLLQNPNAYQYYQTLAYKAGLMVSLFNR